jgi:hypothetical protein
MFLKNGGDAMAELYTVGAWKPSDAVRGWKSSPEFRERISQIKRHVDEFEPTELTVVATAESGAGAVEPSPLQVESIHAP